MDILDFIDEIPDPRMPGKVTHKLSTIIFVGLCGVLSACETWSDIAEYCAVKKDWLSQFVDLSPGIPSAWTFRRVFSLLDPQTMEELLINHAKTIVVKRKDTAQIAIDGKALRGSQRQDLRCLHSISAWCHENGLVLAEKQVDAKSNEIKTIPLLLEALDLKKKTVSLDAAGCQKSIAAQIKDKKGDYVLSLKKNHPKLQQAVIEHIKKQDNNSKNLIHDEFDESHGRVIRRRYFSYDIPKVPETMGWAGMQSIIAVETISSRNNDPNRKVTAEWRYYISSHKKSQSQLQDYIRHHWSIENRLHWILDVQFKEDDDLKSDRRSARSFSILRRIALNIVRTKDLTPKRSVKRKLKRSGWDNSYLLEILS